MYSCLKSGNQNSLYHAKGSLKNAALVPMVVARRTQIALGSSPRKTGTPEAALRPAPTITATLRFSSMKRASSVMGSWRRRILWSDERSRERNKKA